MTVKPLRLACRCVAWGYLEAHGSSERVGGLVVVDQPPMMARRFGSHCHSSTLCDPYTITRLSALLTSAPHLAVQEYLSCLYPPGESPLAIALDEMARCNGPAAARLLEDYTAQDW